MLFRAVLSARRVQRLLWGDSDNYQGLEEWRRMFRKRWAKIDEVKLDNPHWHIELKKRLLQNAALSIALLGIVNSKYRPSLLTNYADYAEDKTEVKA